MYFRASGSQLVNEWSYGKGIHGHCQRITLCGPFHRSNLTTACYEQSDRGSVGLYQSPSYSEGQMTQMLWRAALWLSKLKAWTSPTPIGLTPGHLSSGSRWQATKAPRPSGLTPVVAMRRPTTASAIHRLFDADLKEEQSLLHTYASSLEGPAAPWLCRAACLMPPASRPSNVMGLTGSDSPSTREHLDLYLKVCFSFKTSLVDCSMDSPVFVVSGTGSSNLSTCFLKGISMHI